ncbi:ANM_HP_G0261030.mRNA.1.CDS.1 [Saccharomyces cerevisiae]|nr:ANM_HP_G0159080.mRNA.1.CDS.1 [Saccharomyces cerevisiae]CAI5206484.1 ANM_HP_G0261030.mRNA.1.CDS.1 [Saccharomyces cerevisiae]CAI6806691.1 ANM_collapsed_G0037020.mRNA.1.CDS.1 [Saccharomyces cerevisiae]CAI6887686.1 ANM_HP_G0159080.mRNA.1.CDS.1 [Saccharomyces cerevisiae]CAI7012268.1 ANM_HP_G0261030.mRNA.1.CDS.1 [Saccharomyces cerevisiae]
MDTLEPTAVDTHVSAEQILRDVYKKGQKARGSTNIDILDLEELREYQRRKRTEYEGYLKRNRLDMGQWIRYAQFEIEQHDMRRARSIYERALLVDSSFIPLWIRYIDAELKVKCINHARNLMNRAISTLPRVDKLWYKYLIVEESLNNVEIVRSLYTKWCSLEPGVNAWNSFVDFEIRQQNWNGVREIYSKYVMAHPQMQTWLKWVRFENRHGNTEFTRSVYSLAIDTVANLQNLQIWSDMEVAKLVNSFAHWEAAQQEYERSSALYQIAIEKWPSNQLLKAGLLDFEKQFGDINSIEETISYKRKMEYETILSNNAYDYDTWWLYLDLISESFPKQIMQTFEKAVVDSRPKELSKNVQWKRYIYLWMRYICYVELELENSLLEEELFQRLIDDIIPHKHFTFSKIWLMYAKFLIRHDDVPKARKILGKAIGLCPKAKTFKGYIELEVKLKEFDRVRKIYEKFIEFQPSDLQIWSQYGELEENLGDWDRVRGIYTIALDENSDFLTKEAKIVLLQKYITFETESQEFEKARKLYRRYLELNQYSPQSWIEFAMYQTSTPTEQQLLDLAKLQSENVDEDIEFEITDENKLEARKVFEEAIVFFKEKDDKQGRLSILEALKDYEETYGTELDQETVKKRFPKVIKKVRLQDGVEEEFVDYVFPDDIDDDKPKPSKFLELAKKWKQEQAL